MIFDIYSLDRYRPSLRTVSNCNNFENVTGLWTNTIGLSKSFITSLKKTSIITSSGASTRIENALMTDNQVEEFVAKGKAITKLSTRSEREVFGYLEVLEYIYESGGTDSVSEHTIKSMHQMMTHNFSNEMLSPNLRGTYKTSPNNVVEQDKFGKFLRTWFETTPPGPQTATSMSALIESFHRFEEAGLPKSIIIGWFVVHFLAIHPFQDGNGRLSRLITIWLLLKGGYTWIPFVSHEKFIEDNKDRYYQSLRATQASFRNDKIDYEPWMNFFTFILSQQADYLKSQVLTKIEKEKNYTRLGNNEQLVVDILKQYGPHSRSELAKKISMSDIGMKKLLLRLREKKIVEIIGRGKNTKYKLP